MPSNRRTVTLLLLDGEVKNPIRAFGEPVFIGDAGVDYLCAGCGVPLCVGMRDGDLAGLTFLCGCGASSSVPWPADERPAAADVFAPNLATA